MPPFNHEMAGLLHGTCQLPEALANDLRLLKEPSSYKKLRLPCSELSCAPVPDLFFVIVTMDLTTPDHPHISSCLDHLT